MATASPTFSPDSARTVDRYGALASTACAAHCILSAFLPEVLGTVGLGVLLGSGSEWGFTLIALALAATALWLGWRRHRSLTVLVLFGVGITALLLARLLEDAFGEVAGATLSVLAGLTLVGGHFFNSRAARRASLQRT